MIRILIVDDSYTDTMLLKNLFEQQSDMTVVGCARNGEEALLMVEELKPDLITMDIIMPGMDGYQATKMIMTKFPTPVVVISSNVTEREKFSTFEALESGALTALAKPFDIYSNEFQEVTDHIVETVRNMSQVRVMKKSIFKHAKNQPISISNIHKKKYQLVVIGSSVGGPQALKKVLSQLPSDFSLPVVIVQHMTPGYIEGLAKWLSDNVAINVKCVTEGEKLKSGTVYFAPDGAHLTLNKKGNQFIAELKKGSHYAGFCPSITLLMKSIAPFCHENVIGILLTGMGSDGAEGLLELKHKGAHTIVQDSHSCVVFGMGNVAKNFGAVDKEMDLERIGEYLVALSRS